MPKVDIPNDWDGETYECYTVKWPASFEWRAILNGLIDTAGTGWYYNEATGNVISARDAIKATWSYNFRNEVCLMSCNEDTQAFFERMAIALEALVNKPCCPTGGAGSGIFNSGSRGAGITPEIINPYTENLELEEPPVGFDTWAAYREHKCNASADLVQAFKVDLLSLSNLIPEGKMFTVIVAELVAVLLTPIPFDDVASIVGWLVVGAFEYSLLAELSTGVQDDESNLRCILYSSSNATNAQADFRNRIEELVEEVTGLGIAQDWLNSIVDNLTPNDAFNRIFEAGSTTIQDADCSGCLDTSPYTVNYGTETSENPSNPIVIEMVYEAGYACGATARNAGINFSSPVQITGIEIDGVGVGECSGGFLFGYGTDPGDEAGVDAPDAADSTYPSVGDPTVPIYSMYVLCDVTSGNPVLTVTYIVG